MRVSEARFREVFDFSPVGIAITDTGGRIVQTNRSLEKILGYRPDQLLGPQLSDLPAPGHQPIVEEHYRGLAADRDSRFRVRLPLRRADGETAWVYLGALAQRGAVAQPLTRESEQCPRQRAAR
ncbi:MAG: PAS domain S-box protein [Pseudonocardiaceae bacterium]